MNKRDKLNTELNLLLLEDMVILEQFKVNIQAMHLKHSFAASTKLMNVAC